MIHLLGDLGWVDFVWMLHDLVQLHSRFCQIPTSPRRSGQTVEHPNRSQPNPGQVREEMGHLVKLSVQGDTSGWELHFVDFVFVVLPYSAWAAANLAELA